jgi:hypothetical protein
VGITYVTMRAVVDVRVALRTVLQTVPSPSTPMVSFVRIISDTSAPAQRVDQSCPHLKNVVSAEVKYSVMVPTAQKESNHARFAV